MAKQNLTVYQRLTKVFGFQAERPTPPQYKFDRDQLLKTDSREDYEREMLQQQQSQYIADKWDHIAQNSQGI